jgi:hypothetical protein
MCFLIIADHLLEHIIEKIVIGNNWQHQQLCTIIDNYFADAQSNLAEPQMHILTWQSHNCWKRKGKR